MEGRGLETRNGTVPSSAEWSFFSSFVIRRQVELLHECSCFCWAAASPMDWAWVVFFCFCWVIKCCACVVSLRPLLPLAAHAQELVYKREGGRLHFLAVPKVSGRAASILVACGLFSAGLLSAGVISPKEDYYRWRKGEHL